MVDLEHNEHGDLARIILQPNQSISWRATRHFYISLVFIIAVIASGLTALGFWLILPFAGLELLLLGSGLYIVARKGQQREVISLTSDEVFVERGHLQPEQQWKFLRVWATVILEQCPKQWYPSRLLIRSHGKGVEIGRFLNEEERHYLATELLRNLR